MASRATTAMSKDAMAIRLVRREDRADWMRLWTAYHADGRSSAPAVPDMLTEATWNGFFHGHEPMEALVAERVERIVGFAHMVFHRSTSATGLVCFLQDLFVDAPLRGKGVGRALIEAVYANAAAAGAARVYWHVLEENTAALRLYDSVAARSGHVVYGKDLRRPAGAGRKTR